MSNGERGMMPRAPFFWRARLRTKEHTAMDTLTDLLRETAKATANLMSAFKARYGSDEVPDNALIYEWAIDHAEEALKHYGKIAELTSEEKALIDWWDHRPIGGIKPPPM
jgi:hypothetical protein